MPSIELIQQLRQQTGVGIMDASRALDEAGDDIEKALEILRKKGAVTAAKKSSREAHDGVVISYIHAGGRVGVLLKLYCETDFVARTKEFQALARDLTMHIAASDPDYVSVGDIPDEVLETEKRIYHEQVADSGKPDNIIDQIIEGKMKKFAEQVVLLKQPFIKDPDKRIEELLQDSIARLGENIQVGKFVRYEL